MKKFWVCLVALFGFPFILLPMVVSADTVNVTLTGVEGSTNGPYYIAPYYLSINGAVPADAFCVDFNHDSNIGNSWTTNVTSVSGSSFGNTYQSNQTAYLEMGYLASIYGSNPGSQKYIQQAIWDISTGKTFLDTPYTDSSTKSWYDQALGSSNYNGWNTSGWVILTDPNGKNQEMLTQGPVATPEPGTIVLLGSGILGVYGFSRKKELSLKLRLVYRRVPE